MWDAGQQTVTVACNSVIAILLVKFLPIDEYGAYSYAIAAVTIALSLSSAGLSGLAVKLLVNDRARNPAILVHLLLARMLFAGIGLLAVALISLTSSSSQVVSATCIASIALFGKALEAPETWFLSHLKSSRVASARLVVSLILLAGRLGLLFILPSLWVFVSLYAVEALATGIMIIVRYRRETAGHGWEWQGLRNASSETFSLIRQSSPLMISGLANQINMKSDILVLQALSSVSAVAVYALAAKVSELAYFFPVVFMNALLPKLTSLRRDPAFHRAYLATLQRAYDLAFWTGILLAAGIGVAGVFLIPVFLGGQYEASSEILLVHVAAAPFIFMAAVYSKWIIVEGVLWTSVLRHICGALVNVALCLVLIPRFGGLGAAYSTVSSYIMASYLAAFLTSSTRSQAMMMSKAILAPVRAIVDRIGFRVSSDS